MARTTRRARDPRSPRTPRSPARRCPAGRSRAPRTPTEVGSAAPPTGTCRWFRSRLQVVRVLRQVLRPVLRDEHEVLEADTSVALAVAPGLDRDHVAGLQRQLRSEAHAGLLVHLEPDAVTEPVEEAFGEGLALLLRALCRLAGRLEDLARAVEDRAAVRAVLDLGDRAVERLLRERVPLLYVLRHVADDVRARHVAEHERLVVARPDVDHDRHTGPDRPRPHVVADRSLRARSDDEVVRSGAVGGERAGHRRLHALDREHFPVDLERTPAVRLRAPQEVTRRVHPRLGRALRAPDALELRIGLDAAAVIEEVRVHGQLDAVRAEAVGEPERERLRDDRARDAETLHGPEDDLLPHLGIRETGAHELVRPVLLGRVQLEEPELGEARNLHGADRNVLRAVLLGVEERIGD